MSAMALVMAYVPCVMYRDTNHIFYTCVTTQFVWSCIREVLGSRWCPSNFPDFFMSFRHVLAKIGACFGWFLEP